MAPAAALGLRFVAAFALLGTLPTLVWQALPAVGVDTLALGDGEQFAWGTLGLGLACVCVLALARLGPPLAPWRPARAAWVLSRYLPFAALWLVFVVVYLQLAHRLGHGLVPQAQLAALAHADVATASFWITVVGIVVIAPVIEEIVFRGFLQGALQYVVPRWAAIAIAAAVFGVCHTLPYAVPIGLLGGLFGWLFSRSGSLLPSVVAHATHNLLTVVVTFAWPQSIDLMYPK